MEKNWKSKLDAYVADGIIPEKFARLLGSFFACYRDTLTANHIPITHYTPLFEQYLDLVATQFRTPFPFELYHQQIRTPFDYYTFSKEFLDPLIDTEHSSVRGLQNVAEISSLLTKGENVILLANHQTEADPLAISILIEKQYPKLASALISVAGERVITDPLAVPFSMGCNLLCIYSKRYIDHPPEQKREKQLHNKRTVELMSALLSEGGKLIYVAPSGGRDRPNAQGQIEVAPFDPKSIEMFHLMAKKASSPTHFFPLALATYNLLPPPETIQVELGEMRTANRGPIHLAFGTEIDMEHFPGSDTPDKHTRRENRAHYIWQQVCNDYAALLHPA